MRRSLAASGSFLQISGSGTARIMRIIEKSREDRNV